MPWKLNAHSAFANVFENVELNKPERQNISQKTVTVIDILPLRANLSSGTTRKAHQVANSISCRL